MNRHYMLEALILSSGGRLPSAYQEVEYIESTGTQYIDTGLIFNRLCEFKIVFEPLVKVNNANAFKFGAYVTDLFAIGFDNNHDNRLAGYYSNSHEYNFDNVPYSEGRNVAIKNGNIISINGSLVFMGGFSSSVFSQPLVLMHPTTRCLYRYFELHCKDSRYEIKLIPCYRKSDGKIGLYDLVNNVFYTNQGTGTFLKGPDVN